MHLAFVIITITTPGEYDGVRIQTAHPVECNVTMDAMIDAAAELGLDSYGRCVYTSAPSTSLRPVARK